MHRPGQVIRSRWKCVFCVNISNSSRSISTTKATRAIGPESPKYIDIPEPSQQRQPPKPRVKGILPVPRDIFQPRQGGIGKVTDEYLDAATQNAKGKQTRGLSEAQKAQIERKQRMATKRKENLREGLLELQARRKKQLSDLAERRAKLTADSEESRRRQVERNEDERLTSPTVVQANQLCHTAPFLPDPNRFERIARMKANVAEQQTKKANERKLALHELYMNARSFIVNEKDLDEAIDKAFGTVDNPRSWGGAARGESIWFEGMPDTVEKMMARASKASTRSTDSDEYNAEVTEKRLRRIAEELTGGKMES